MSQSDHAAFIAAHTIIDTPALVPEVRLYLATEVTPLWQATESFLEQNGLPPPFWAFAWPGGLALARYILDHRDCVAGKRVLSFAAGSGVDAVAAALAGATSVAANEIDDFALAAIALNAALNGVDLSLVAGNVMGTLGPWDVVIAGDVCYEKPMAEKAAAWFTALTAAGVTVLLADPGRTYLPTTAMERLETYTIAVSRDLEDKETRVTSVFRWG